jgi:hypothetical protein
MVEIIDIVFPPRPPPGPPRDPFALGWMNALAAVPPWVFVVALAGLWLAMWGLTGLSASPTEDPGVMGWISKAVWMVAGVWLLLYGLDALMGTNLRVDLWYVLMGSPGTGWLHPIPTPAGEPGQEGGGMGREIGPIPQVFHVPDNRFQYDEARAVCTAYGARLANYHEVEDAYRHGGEFCQYGWSEGQMALYPTQSKTYETLQKIPGHEHDCGRPGVNGGYMANPKVRYGVNCFGLKPRMTPTEQYLMENQPPVSETNATRTARAQVEYWKTHLSSLLVAPFNARQWSRL